MSPTQTSATDSFNEICTVRIELRDTEPLIWREVEVPTSITLKVLHDIVQITIGWFDMHLWEFTIGDRRYGPKMEGDWRDTPRTEAIKARLRDVLTPGKTVIDYVYDFGDGWAHHLTVSEVRQGLASVSYPNYVGGEWACPPENCGGVSGYYQMLDVLGDPKHPDNAEVADYLEGWDPREIEEFPLRVALGRLANRRTAARVRIAKKMG